MNTYTIRPGFALVEVFSQPYLMASRSLRKIFPVMTPLNATGAKIWSGFAEGESLDHIVKKIADHYCVEDNLVRRDVIHFCLNLIEKGYLIQTEVLDADKKSRSCQQTAHIYIEDIIDEK